MQRQETMAAVWVFSSGVVFAETIERGPGVCSLPLMHILRGRRCAVLAYSLLNAPGAGIHERARVTHVVSVFSS